MNSYIKVCCAANTFGKNLHGNMLAIAKRLVEREAETEEEIEL
jgi:hypothetical protein